MHSFWVFFYFWTFFKIFTCCNFKGRILRLFAFGSLLVPSEFLVVYISNVWFIWVKNWKKKLTLKKKSMDKALNKLSNAKKKKKTEFSSFKLWPVKTYRGEKGYFTGEKISQIAECHWSYIWQTSSSHIVCMVTERLKFLVSVSL